MKVLPTAGFLLLAAHLVSLAVRSHSDTTVALVVSALLLFVVSWISAAHLLGVRAACKFAAIAVVFGWFAEQMGASHGWFFGEYDYTDVLGARIGEVPAIIPLQWFAVAYMGYVISNLIVWRAPVDGSPRWTDAIVMSFLGAMVITAFDLGADPYFVFQLKAWIMVKKDGWWFGETLQGFVGWMFVSFTILMTFRVVTRRSPPVAMPTASRRHVLIPLGVYAGYMVFQAAVGLPVETRTVAVFAMGIPLLSALASWQHWRIAGGGRP